MRIIRSISLIFLISVFFSGTALSQFGSVYFEPDTTIIGVNDSCLIDIMVDSHLSGIHCFIVSVGFDTSLVDLSDVTEGALLPNAGQTFFFWNANNGGYDIGSCLLGYGLFVDGPGVLATIKFVSRADTGTSSLHFTAQEFTDTLQDPIYVLPLYGAIVVSDTLDAIYDDGSEFGLPDRFFIYGNYPNPFNSSTSIEYHLVEPGFVRLEIYDILGRLRDVLVSGSKTAGDHRVVWNPQNAESGVYFVRLSFDGNSDAKKMILLK